MSWHYRVYIVRKSWNEFYKEERVYSDVRRKKCLNCKSVDTGQLSTGVSSSSSVNQATGGRWPASLRLPLPAPSTQQQMTPPTSGHPDPTRYLHLWRRGSLPACGPALLEFFINVGFPYDGEVDNRQTTRQLVWRWTIDLILVETESNSRRQRLPSIIELTINCWVGGGVEEGGSVWWWWWWWQTFKPKLNKTLVVQCKHTWW